MPNASNSDMMLEVWTTWAKYVGSFPTVGATCKATGLSPDEVYEALDHSVKGLRIVPLPKFIAWLDMLDAKCTANRNLGLDAGQIAEALNYSKQRVLQIKDGAIRKMKYAAKTAKLNCVNEYERCIKVT